MYIRYMIFLFLAVARCLQASAIPHDPLTSLEAKPTLKIKEREPTNLASGETKPNATCKLNKQASVEYKCLLSGGSF
ncbi:hypothetical protein K1T71_014582 [Dendrolimus kikuchii]|uniref:Uncharacterized protein n=1 Tax=Dendrolimus kikuchii TaxID=765133 RepID=A0ACC1CEK3_9NEOP|nr:hypothetical protein K1T71_014582 [Dendrolimus kikuchii]